MKIRQTKGFTIVELTIVIAVIGILASISVVSYGNWRERTARSEVQSDLKQVAAAMESAKNFDNGYPLSLSPSLYTPSDSVTLTYVMGSAKSFCIDGVSKVRPTTVQYYFYSEAGKDPKVGQCLSSLPPSAPVIAYDDTGVYYDSSQQQVNIKIQPSTGILAASYRFSYRVGSGAWIPVTPSSGGGVNYIFNTENVITQNWDTYGDGYSWNQAFIRVIAVSSSGVESQPTDLDYGSIWYY